MKGSPAILPLLLLLVCSLTIGVNSIPSITQIQPDQNSGVISLFSNQDLVNFISDHGFSGSGTETDPFIIDNWSSNVGTGVAVQLVNINYHVIVRESTITSSSQDPTVILSFARNIDFYNNSINGGLVGIQFDNSESLEIMDNAFSNHGFSSVNGWDNVDIIIEGNQVSNNRDHGIHIFNSQNIQVNNNQVSETGKNGITIYQSSNCEVGNNTVELTGWPAILAGESSQSMIQNNILREGNEDGIRIMDSSSITVFNNSVDDFNWEGIQVTNSYEITVINNTVSNTRPGIVVRHSDAELVGNHILTPYEVYLHMHNATVVAHQNFFRGPTNIAFTFNSMSPDRITMEKNGMGNYYGRYSGYDLDGDLIGDIPFTYLEYIEDTNPLMRYYFEDDIEAPIINLGDVTIREDTPNPSKLVSITEANPTYFELWVDGEQIVDRQGYTSGGMRLGLPSGLPLGSHHAEIILHDLAGHTTSQEFVIEVIPVTTTEPTEVTTISSNTNLVFETTNNSTDNPTNSTATGNQTQNGNSSPAINLDTLPVSPTAFLPLFVILPLLYRRKLQ